MSVTTLPAVIAFATAQRNLVTSRENYRHAFVASAMACSDALKVKGVSLAKLADANKELSADIIAAPKGLLMTSPTGVSWHAWTGDVFTLAFDEDGDDMPEPETVQSIISRMYKDARFGATSIKACIRRATSQQECLGFFRDALATPVEETAPESADETGTDETDETGETSTMDPSVKVETLLMSALALVSAGAELTDAARAIIAQLSGPVAVPAVA